MYYAIQAMVETSMRDSHGQEWTGSRQVPTFYLHDTVNAGLNEESAAETARSVIDPLGIIGHERIHVTAVALEE